MRTIGVFDSGVGGVSVLKEILKVLPNDKIVYFGDSLHAPYGDRTLEEIRELCLKVSDFLVYEKKVDALVIACNTATGAAKLIMDKKYDIPVIGVIEPGAKEAINISKNGNIAVFATPATVKMGAYSDTLKRIDSNLNIKEVACPHFVAMIENGWVKNSESVSLIERYVGELDKDMDTLVLGCTHYPLIERYISEIYKGKIVDPAKETAKSLKNIIGEGKNTTPQEIEFYVSGDLEKFRNVAEGFLEKEITYLKKKILK